MSHNELVCCFDVHAVAAIDSYRNQEHSRDVALPPHLEKLVKPSFLPMALRYMSKSLT